MTSNPGVLESADASESVSHPERSPHFLQTTRKSARNIDDRDDFIALSKQSTVIVACRAAKHTDNFVLTPRALEQAQA